MSHLSLKLRLLIRIRRTLIPSRSSRRRLSLPRHKTRPTDTLPPKARLGIHDTITALCSLHELRVLFTESSEVLLGVPVPPGVGGEEEIHFFEGALVGFWVEAVDDRDGEEVDGAEDIEDFFGDVFEHDREEEDLEIHN